MPGTGNDAGPDVAEWVIRSGKYYYRENFLGYTLNLSEAGRFTKAQAEWHAAVEPMHTEAIYAPKVPYPIGELIAARETLARLGYTFNGGSEWRPPVGKIPDFDLLERKNQQIAENAARIIELEGHVKRLTGCLLVIAGTPSKIGAGSIRTAAGEAALLGASVEDIGRKLENPVVALDESISRRALPAGDR